MSLTHLRARGARLSNSRLRPKMEGWRFKNAGVSGTRAHCALFITFQHRKPFDRLTSAHLLCKGDQLPLRKHQPERMRLTSYV